MRDERFERPYVDSTDRVVVVLGAGASIGEMQAAKVADRLLPPADANFLARARELLPKSYREVEALFDRVWNGDEPRPMKHQRMEMLFSSAFLRVQQTSGTSKAGRAARDLYAALVGLLRDTLSMTTNLPTSAQHLRLLALVAARAPRSLDLLSFNYDVLADRALRIGNGRGLWNWHPADGYGFTPGNLGTPKTPSRISLLKLHGSMNWYVPAPGRTRASPFRSNSPIYVPVPAANPAAAAWQRRQHTLGRSTARIFPLMVPPVFEKGSQIVGELRGLWDQAGRLLRDATVVIVWGYSLPPADYHAEVLFAQGARRAKYRLIAVNPDRAALAHVTDVCGHAWNRWYFRIEHLLREMDA